MHRPGRAAHLRLAFKRQQFRWSKGSFQVLRKLGGQVLAARRQRPSASSQASCTCGLPAAPAHDGHLLLSLPIVLLAPGRLAARLGLLGLAGLGPPLLVVLGQIRCAKTGRAASCAIPSCILIGIGLACGNTRAALKPSSAPTASSCARPKGGGSVYALRVDWSTWGEAFLAFYALVTGLLALELAPGMAPFVFLYALGFGYTAALGFWQADRLEQRRATRQTR